MSYVIKFILPMFPSLSLANKALAFSIFIDEVRSLVYCLIYNFCLFNIVLKNSVITPTEHSLRIMLNVWFFYTSSFCMLIENKCENLVF